MTKTILVIEDESAIADSVIHSIQREGYAASWCERGFDGLELLKTQEFLLLVLDVGLPDINGFELCRQLRAFSNIPVIFLTARDDEVDKIVGLEIGADDYMTKPFSPRELGARIKSVLRRSELAAGITSTQVPVCRLIIEMEKLQATYCEKRLDLTRYEFGLLALLAKKPGRVYSREQIMQKVWGEDSPSLDRTVDAHIKSLRAKCREIDDSIDPIITHRGSGYALREDL